VPDKVEALRYLSSLAAEQLGLGSADEIFSALIEREQLATTGIGFGIAIPHCRLPNCEEVNAVLLRLENPVDFDAIDDEPVDLVCALIVPEQDAELHLQALSILAQRFNDPAFRETLRAATSETALYDAAVSYDR
jgi:PTS system nitrogen regulatory IIA component